MANVSLASKYRPQNFADVVGQDTIKSILSRACLQNKIAPAYLLCGTRGVGKTTLARVFAKALNCEKSPTAEPCNVCSNCKQITQGSFVDVVEIDGASNRGIDDIRKLRETVGYSPLNGRYKVIIIDEAHMLTKEAFNALLKTLEEPPKNVVFVLATTEQHKFPITILSRCQQFVFKQVSESALEQHLSKVLTLEKINFEEEALALISRRASGSVRDSMSLLGQCLAFMLDENEILAESKVKAVLGLVGLELMDKLLNSIANQDIQTLTILLKNMFVDGIDISFFLKEFSTLWRNLFVLKQAGKNALDELPEKEIVRLEAYAKSFSITFIHAAWQMTLDNQRRILQSLEPASALELLMLNLALLPQLLPLNDLNMAKANKDAQSEGIRGEFVTPCNENCQGESNFEQFKSNQSHSKQISFKQTEEKQFEPKNNLSEQFGFEQLENFSEMTNFLPKEDFQNNLQEKNSNINPDLQDDFFTPVFSGTEKTYNTKEVNNNLTSVKISPLDLLKNEIEKSKLQTDDHKINKNSDKDFTDRYEQDVSLLEFEDQYSHSNGYNEFNEISQSNINQTSFHEQDLFLQTEQEKSYESVSWDKFLEFCQEKDFPIEYIPYLNFCSAKYNQSQCIIKITSETALTQIKVVQKKIEILLLEFLQEDLDVFYALDEQKRRSLTQMMNELHEHEQIKLLQREFNAILIRCSDLKK